MLVPGNQMMLRTITIPPPAGGYPLADDGTVAGLFGVGHIPFNAPVYNTATYHYQAPATNNTAVGTPDLANLFGSQMLPFPPSNYLACEFEITTPPAGQYDSVSLFFGFFNGFSIAGSASIGIQDNGTPVYSLNNYSSIPRADTTNVRVGMVLDKNTNTGWYVFAEDPTTAYPFSIPASATGVVFLVFIGDNGTTLNTETTTVKLVPNGADMTALYPAGTVDYAGNPCPTNPSWNPLAPPMILSAATNTDGTQITLTFDQAVSGSNQIGWTYEYDTGFGFGTLPLSGYSQPTPDTFVVTPSVPIIATYSLRVSYTNPPGGVKSIPGVPLADITNLPITNNVTPVLNCGMPFHVTTGGPTMSNFDMTMNWSTTLGTHLNINSHPVGYPTSPYNVVVNNGRIVVMEFSPDNLPIPTASTNFKAVMDIVDNSGYDFGHIYLEARASDGHYYLTSEMATFGSTQYDLGTTKPSRIGMEFDNSSGYVFRLYADNVLIDTRNYQAFAVAVFQMRFEAVNVAAGDVGTNLQMTFYTYAPDFTNYVYSTGAVDNCNQLVSGVQCAFPFTMPDAGITMSNFSETATLTTASGTNSYLTHTPYTTNFWDTSYTVDIATGTKVFEWIPNALPHPIGGFTYWQQVVNLTDTTGTNVGYITLEASGGNYNIQLYLVNGPSSSSYTIGTTLPSRIGVAFESAGPTVRVYVDNVQRLTGTYLTADSPIVLDMDFETVSVAGGDIGQTIQMTFIPGAANMTGTTYPVGATDNCGNTI